MFESSSSLGYPRPVVSTRLRPTELRAWQALLHAYQHVVRRLDLELREDHGLSLAAYDVLLRLARAPGRALRMTELAERVMLSPSGVTRTVDRLVDRGLVERGPDPEDGRGAVATLTGRGRTELRRASGTHLRGIREHFTGRLSDADLNSIAGALEAITGPHAPH